MAGGLPANQTPYEPTVSVVVRPNPAHRVKALMMVSLVLLDTLMLTAGFVLGYWARVAIPLANLSAAVVPFSDYWLTLLLHVSVTLAVFYMARHYHQRRIIGRIDQARSILGTVMIGAVLVYGFQGLLFRNSPFDVDYSRSMFLYVSILSAFFAVFGREIYRMLRAHVRTKGWDRDNLLIVGSSKPAQEIIRKTRANLTLGYNLVGVVNGRPKGKVEGLPVLGTYYDLPDIIDQHQVEHVIIAAPDATRSQVVDWINLCQRGNVDVKIYPDMLSYLASDMVVDEMDGITLIAVRDVAMRGWKLSIKRAIDVFGSVFGLVVLSPFMLLTAAIIKLQSPGPVFYSQVRMGLDGKPFPMIKFRSMRADAEANGPGWTKQNDDRVTAIGKFMRRTNWDEIPQLINVALGHMSLVGPRPERPFYVQQFRERIPRYMDRHREKAGMTGWAQVNGLRGDTSIEERTTYDLWYVEHWSLWLDIKILIRQIFQTIFRLDKNAY